LLREVPREAGGVVPMDEERACRGGRIPKKT